MTIEHIKSGKPEAERSMAIMSTGVMNTVTLRHITFVNWLVTFFRGFRQRQRIDVETTGGHRAIASPEFCDRFCHYAFRGSANPTLER